MALPTLLDIAKKNGTDGVVGLIDETTRVHPEIRLIAARTIKGTSYKTRVRVALGNVTGSFRDGNEGVASHKHTYENRRVETYIMEPRFECDKAIADRSEDGPQAYIAEEAEGTMEGEFQALARQFYYGRGTGGHAKGYPGLLQSYDATNMVVDAGGTTADTGSSVWFVRTDVKDVRWVWGENGSLQLSPVRIESLLDPNDSTKKFTGYVQTMLAYPGLQVGSVHSICRIKKLTADSGKGWTDALNALALAKYPAGKGPNLCFATQRSLAQLQTSRTATSPTGAPAPFPTSITGIDGQMIPIHVTDSILNTEALTL